MLLILKILVKSFNISWNYHKRVSWQCLLLLSAVLVKTNLFYGAARPKRPSGAATSNTKINVILMILNIIQ